MQAGDIVTVSFDIESREFNGRWYTDIHAWQVDLHDRPQASPYPDSFFPGNTSDMYT
jgi:hypothetical protein